MAQVEDNLLDTLILCKSHKKQPFQIFIMGTQEEAPVAEKENETADNASENAGGFADYLVRNMITLKDMC